MVKTLLLSAAFLLSAVWLQAQDQSSNSSSGQTGSSASRSSQTGSSQSTSTTGSDQSTASQAGTASGAATVQGCLHNSGGNYILISDSGTTYQLQGDTSKLAEHVEHEVAVTGSSSGSTTPPETSSNTGSTTSPAGSAGTGASGAQTSSGSQATINVTAVQHVSKTCTGGASTTTPTK